MPQIVLIALVGAGVWLGWRILKKEMARVDRDLRKAEDDPIHGENPVALEKDPETGVYKPKK
ncbi:MAG: hypothetical protein KDJ16_03880 [Hyphomicrobiales bacterium]|nr:hypothetical protein [Hyphomicrobiales bacterium]